MRKEDSVSVKEGHQSTEDDQSGTRNIYVPVLETDLKSLFGKDLLIKGIKEAEYQAKF